MKKNLMIKMRHFTHERTENKFYVIINDFLFSFSFFRNEKDTHFYRIETKLTRSEIFYMFFQFVFMILERSIILSCVLCIKCAVYMHYISKTQTCIISRNDCRGRLDRVLGSAMGRSLFRFESNRCLFNRRIGQENFRYFVSTHVSS